MHAVLGLLLCWLAVGGASAAEQRVIEHQSVDRLVLLHRPSGAPAGPLPLVLALHGRGGTAEGFSRELGLDAVADREGFLVAYPEGVERRWNYGRQINQPPSLVFGQEVDDLGLIEKVIDELIAEGLVDSLRVYLLGSSNGGLMAYGAACALPDRFAAVAALITGMTNYMLGDCGEPRALPMLILAGAADQFQSYTGADGASGRLLSVPESVAFWQKRNGCGATSEETLPHRDPADQTSITLLRATGCADDAEVAFYRVNGGGHHLPRVGAHGEQPRTGRRNGDVDTAEEAWRFFARFKR